MSKPRGLGRGLDALLGGDEVAPKDTLATLPVNAIRPGRYQPRSRMDETALAELAASIRAQGLMQPVLVRPVQADAYELIAGERRWRAAQMAGLMEIPALVREVPDEAALAMALIENIQREDLNPLEQANGIQRLVTEFAITHDKAAEMVGRSRSAVTNLLRLLTLAAPVRDLLQQNALDMGHARALLALSGMRQIEAARVALTRGIKRGGLYRYVRHPIYAGYIITYAGFILQNLHVQNAAVIALFLIFLILRIFAEEEFLAQDPVYADYMTKTRWRLFPGVF